MTTVLLAILFAMPQVQPADGTTSPVAIEPSSADDLGVLRTGPHLGRRNHLRNKLCKAEARLSLFAAELNAATNVGMPSRELEGMRREHELMQLSVKILREQWKEELTAPYIFPLHNPPLTMLLPGAIEFPHLRNQLLEAEARLDFVAAFLNLATNSGMPECLLASVRLKHEQMQFVVRILRQEWEEQLAEATRILPLLHCQAALRREQEGNVSGAIIGYLCPHCGKVHASNR